MKVPQPKKEGERKSHDVDLTNAVLTLPEPARKKRICQKTFENFLNYIRKEFLSRFFLARIRENNTSHIKNNVN